MMRSEACSFSVAFWHGYKFTGKERDSESGLDNFGARYFGSSFGRFMTPDWSRDPDPIPYADYENPQTLNLYGNVHNNPLSRRDVTGHVHCGPDKATWD
jgi:RHS repeat-associated protein